MRFIETPLTGAWLIEIDPIQDTRGFFARTYCEDQFSAYGLETHWPQCSISYNRRRGTLRGLHYQIPPHEETKLVRCTQGAVFDVIVDLRPDSVTHRQWFSTILSQDNRHMLYVPAGFAHGFQTLVDESEVYYQISQRYVPEASAGIRWNDPALGIKWPLSDPILSDRDRAYPDLK